MIRMHQNNSSNDNKEQRLSWNIQVSALRAPPQKQTLSKGEGSQETRRTPITNLDAHAVHIMRREIEQNRAVHALVPEGGQEAVKVLRAKPLLHLLGGPFAGLLNEE
jgi:hypothetical protein